MSEEDNKIVKLGEGKAGRSIDKSRRSFAKAGVVAPVIMSLTSKPAFALQALSNMCSIAPSSACHGNDRYGGMSPGFWKTPSGNTSPFNDKWYDAWDLAGFDYAEKGTGIGYSSKGFKLKAKDPEEYRCSKRPNQYKTESACTSNQGSWLKQYEDGNQWSDYVGGSANPFNSPGSMREVLGGNPGSEEFHLLAGLLNASYFEAKAGSPENTQYFMTVAQFWGLYNGTIEFPGCFTNLADLISSNYHFGPTSGGSTVDNTKIPSGTCK